MKSLSDTTHLRSCRPCVSTGVLVAVVALLTLAGCAAQQSPGELAAAAGPAAPATLAPPPTPTPTPDPFAVPAWAQGKVLNKVPVRPDDKVFALTFDDGPWPGSTQALLDILDRYKVKATFFMCGSELRARPAVGKAVRAAGHAIGNHSWDHPSRPRDPVGQITRTDAIIWRELGIKSALFRPPYGLLKNGMARQALAEKQTVLIWSADSNDWKKPGSNAIASRIISQASPGGIGLMHDGGGDRDQTVAALPVIIEKLQARGYRLVTIPELLRHRYIAPKPAPRKPNKSAGKAKVAPKAAG